MQLKSLIFLALATTALALPSPTNDKDKKKHWDHNNDWENHDDKNDNETNSTTACPPQSPVIGLSECVIKCLDSYNLRAATNIGAIVTAVCTYPQEYFDGGWKNTQNPNDFGYCEKNCPDGSQLVSMLGYLRNSTLCNINIPGITLPHPSINTGEEPGSATATATATAADAFWGNTQEK
ncbi:uncharacterized protein SPPG_04862 [Spizellomyces punctatus DAOM BR117]|uniref:WSC domain-containing protein n=1 Tax=Spizellomyces punctatus (strain DAOM BR117) TaxID=645134 RepID=A0A0L0HI93_SPIPD|nr:uncharacterized protein SPPG_04862 [Spizellomyces punctatus DAOM BR117]KND00554.1 hypothetical protein SPPG_04862 [Spizellomyces punctatus DAOM BR117]|eukprot:XP_016608593.1 hypothetical protein SPPG_04862 [Spizellomyces punctatus DAOM BR117]